MLSLESMSLSPLLWYNADIITEFDAPGLVSFIQAKKHEGYTDEWAIRQISNYKAQKEITFDDFTYISWVITTVKFKDNVRKIAHYAINNVM